MLVGVMVILCFNRMYEFIEWLINLVLFRIRDFWGINFKSFDGWGNYSLGVKE